VEGFGPRKALIGASQQSTLSQALVCPKRHHVPPPRLDPLLQAVDQTRRVLIDFSQSAAHVLCDERNGGSQGTICVTP